MSRENVEVTPWTWTDQRRAYFEQLRFLKLGAGRYHI